MQLLWIILVASCAALIIQSLAANLGVVTGIDIFIHLLLLNIFTQFFDPYLKCCFLIVGKHLAEHCRIEYPKVPNFILWVLAEIAIVACDIPEGNNAFMFINKR